MKTSDVAQCYRLLKEHLNKFDLAPVFSEVSPMCSALPKYQLTLLWVATEVMISPVLHTLAYRIIISVGTLLIVFLVNL